ncbi:MAG: dihydroorotase [Clostridia bacterium]|nr:dihydroorotase [Clostridia bacterium]
MRYSIKNATVLTENGFIKTDINIDNGIVVSIGGGTLSDATVFDFNNCYIFPGFADVHVHLREPGFSYKETIKTGTAACARGGYTDVCTMPNLNPVPDSIDNIKLQLDIIEKDACIGVHPCAAITVGEKGEELSDIEGLKDYAVAYSDDGRGVQSDAMMTEAMERVFKCGKMITAHCEVNELLNGGYIREGEYSKAHGHKGIVPESEWKMVERDIRLAKKTGCPYHVCHISTKESVELIRQAKRDGVDVTAETAPHYLILTEDNLCEDARFKMNPPLGNKADREALIEGIIDGTIEMIATDHAPHSKEEKSRGLEKSMMGIVGIETAFALMYTHFVKTGIVSLEKLIELMSLNPRKRFSLGKGVIKVGEKADFTVFDLNESYIINSDEFLSMGKSTPFEGKPVLGRCKMTFAGGNLVWKE